MSSQTEESLKDAGAIFLIVAGIFFFANKLGFGLNISVGNSVGLGAAFVFGLVASFTTCAASVGGLLLGMMNRMHEKNPEMSKAKKFSHYLTFNLGRLIGYAVFGFLVGYLGSVISFSPQINATIIIIASLAMIILGVQMLGIKSGANRFLPHMPLFLARRVHDLADNHSSWLGAVGALTFFLPCGFTQALQLYVLGSGNAINGALIMGIFALGTIPGLLTLGAIESYSTGSWHKELMKYAGAVMIIFSLSQINLGVRAFGFEWPKAQQGTKEYITATQEKDVQVIKMKVDGYEYNPSQFTLKKGVPVEWRIDGSDAAGCAQVLIARKIGVTRQLSTSGETVIKFTPYETGRIDFSCSMGMTTPDAHILVTE